VPLRRPPRQNEHLSLTSEGPLAEEYQQQFSAAQAKQHLAHEQHGAGPTLDNNNCWQWPMAGAARSAAVALHLVAQHSCRDPPLVRCAGTEAQRTSTDMQATRLLSCKRKGAVPDSRSTNHQRHSVDMAGAALQQLIKSSCRCLLVLLLLLLWLLLQLLHVQ
jgi:hypothetical protein